MRFDKIMDAVKSGQVDLGLLIHEGQLTYSKMGLKKIVDLYEYWQEQTSMKLLPHGINVVNRIFDIEKIKKIKKAIQESILYALNNVDEALKCASMFGRGTDPETLRRFALQDVNERTYDMGKEADIFSAFKCEGSGYRLFWLSQPFNPYTRRVPTRELYALIYYIQNSLINISAINPLFKNQGLITVFLVKSNSIFYPWKPQLVFFLSPRHPFQKVYLHFLK